MNFFTDACQMLPGHCTSDTPFCTQASGDGKPPAAAIWTSYISYAFVDFEAATLAVLEACQALTVASAFIPHGQTLFASCLLKGSSGTPLSTITPQIQQRRPAIC